MNKETLLLSVVMITYGHEKFIEQAINGVLMQECSFDFELIVANDCSPDNSDTIIQSIIDNHPKGSKIKYVRHNKNIGMMPNFIFSLNMAEGNYIALCEGDDYWTDSLKLQKQVKFLETNPEFSFCCHRYNIYSEFDKKYDAEIYPLKFIPYNYNLKGIIIDKDIYHSNWITQPLTAVFRRSSLMDHDFKQFKYFRDMHLFYLLLMKNKGFCHEWVAGVYRKHEGGIHIGSNDVDRAKEAILITEELYLFSKDNKFFKIYVANAIGLIKARRHLKILNKSFFVNLSIKDKLDMLKFTFQYLITR